MAMARCAQQPNGSYNIVLGYQAGYQLSTGSSNIDIGSPGVTSENNIIRIGSGQSQTFIAGVINGNGGGIDQSQCLAIVRRHNPAGATAGRGRDEH